jgi:hypothetical protein
MVFNLTLVYSASLIVTCFFMLSCQKDSGGSSGSSSAPIVGLDLTGVWRFSGVGCFNTDGDMTAAYLPSASSAVSTTTVTGNTIYTEALSSSGQTCKVSYSRRIEAILEDGDSSGGWGSGTYGATTATVTPGSYCSTPLTLELVEGGTITPTSLNTYYTQNQSINSQTFSFIYGPPYLFIAALFQVVGRPSDVCFLVHEKI